MKYKIKGLISGIGERKTKKSGEYKQVINFEQEKSGRVLRAISEGEVSLMLEDLLPGDVCELEFIISGAKKNLNKIIIKNITRV